VTIGTLVDMHQHPTSVLHEFDLRKFMCVCVCVCVCWFIYIYMHIYIYMKQRNVSFYLIELYQYDISRFESRTYTIRYQIQNAHKLPSLSLPSVPLRSTYNMSLVMFHLKTCYSITSDRITGLVSQVLLLIRVSKFSLLLFFSCICYWHFHEAAIS
jgi:hypothetical protein